MEDEKILNLIGNYKDEMLKKLTEFIAIASISSNKEKVKEALEYVLDLGKELGFNSESLLNGQIGTIEMGQGIETLGILAHVDVVEPGEVKKWNTEPFSAQAIDGKIYGRGTLDDKGAIIASLYAMKAVCDYQPQKLNKKVRLILGTQEEVDWKDMREYVKKYDLPDYGFTPDGEFPICNIEKGVMDILMHFPLNNNPKTQLVKKMDEGNKALLSHQNKVHEEFEKRYISKIEAGTATNIVPGSCKVTIKDYPDNNKSWNKIETASITKIAFKGKSAHSCNPEKGHNAINVMSKEILKINMSKNKLFLLTEMIEKYFSDIEGEKLGLKSESEYYNGEFVHKNVFSPTIFRSNKNLAEINVNIRFAYGTDTNKIIDRFKELAEEYNGEIININSLPAVYVSKERPFLKVFEKSYEKIRNEKNYFTLAYGGSYAKAMPNIVSWGPIFPGEEDTCHEENEYISINSLIDNAKIFSLAIAEIALSEKSFR